MAAFLWVWQTAVSKKKSACLQAGIARRANKQYESEITMQLLLNRRAVPASKRIENELQSKTPSGNP
jgi:hypothetical protein